MFLESVSQDSDFGVLTIIYAITTFNKKKHRWNPLTPLEKIILPNDDVFNKNVILSTIIILLKDVANVSGITMSDLSVATMDHFKVKTTNNCYSNTQSVTVIPVYHF